MAYICKQCGKILTNSEYNRLAKKKGVALGFGIFFWIIVILCFVAIILIPIAIIMLMMASKKEPECICPYCKSKDSIIPDDTPIAKKLISETYEEKEISAIKEKEKNEINYFWIIIAILLLIFVIVTKLGL